MSREHQIHGQGPIACPCLGMFVVLGVSASVLLQLWVSHRSHDSTLSASLLSPGTLNSPWHEQSHPTASPVTSRTHSWWLGHLPLQELLELKDTIRHYKKKKTRTDEN